MDFYFFGVVDVLIVLMVALFAVFGWKKGFLLTIVKMASSVFGIIASLLLARPFSKVLDNWFGEQIGVKVHEYLLARGDMFTAGLSETNVRTAFESMSLPRFLIDWIVEGIDFDQVGLSIIAAIEPTIIDLVLLVIAFFALFFGSIILFFILKIFAKMVTSIPVIKQIDKGLGVIFGLIKVAAVVYILLFLLALLLTVPAINDLIGDFLAIDMQLNTDEFRVSKWLYNNNILQHIIDVFI
ncbi:MAG: CvpA family protein [Bacilli bacterium]|nr:CvpA family protein [Bacilli bacterium]